MGLWDFMSGRIPDLLITITMAIIIISVCAVCGCIQEDGGITEDEALLIALNDSALTNVTGGSDPGEYESKVTVGEDGKTIYTFHFSPYPSKGYGPRLRLFPGRERYFQQWTTQEAG